MPRHGKGTGRGKRKSNVSAQQDTRQARAAELAHRDAAHSRARRAQHLDKLHLHQAEVPADCNSALPPDTASNSDEDEFADEALRPQPEFRNAFEFWGEFGSCFRTHWRSAWELGREWVIVAAASFPAPAANRSTTATAAGDPYFSDDPDDVVVDGRSGGIFIAVNRRTTGAVVGKYPLCPCWLRRDRDAQDRRGSAYEDRQHWRQRCACGVSDSIVWRLQHLRPEADGQQCAAAELHECRVTCAGVLARWARSGVDPYTPSQPLQQAGPQAQSCEFLYDAYLRFYRTWCRDELDARLRDTILPPQIAWEVVYLDMHVLQAIIRLQAAARGWLFRRFVLHNPHTELGQRFLMQQWARWADELP